MVDIDVSKCLAMFYIDEMNQVDSHSDCHAPQHHEHCSSQC